MSQDERVKGTVQALPLTDQNNPILTFLALPFFPCSHIPMKDLASSNMSSAKR